MVIVDLNEYMYIVVMLNRYEILVEENCLIVEFILLNM